MSTHEINTEPINPEIASSPADFLELFEVEQSSLGAVALLHSTQNQNFHRERADNGLFHGLADTLRVASGIEQPGHSSGLTEIITITPPTTSHGAAGGRAATTMLRHAESYTPVEVSRFERDEAGRWQHIQTVGIAKDESLTIPKGSGVVYGLVNGSVDWRSRDAKSYGDTPRLQSLLELIKLSNESPLRETPDSVRRLPRRGLVQWLMGRRDS